ncbi:winged helix-turn-helix domain-containing protein [Streptomyces sp. NPDC059578]|uniref:winged helix-turn-helix domain-containing protein n=1 Tax=unclassified Streptomyces TaxID=2593676 RepID=UPI00364C7CEC
MNDTAASDPDRSVLDLSLDPRALRVLAHPVRVALLTHLRWHGPATGRQLARRFDLDSGAASYHLRRLAAGGLIEEDRERGSKRERWWRPRHTTTEHDPAHTGADGTDQRAYVQAVALAQSETLRRVATETVPALPDPWFGALAFTDHQLWLTPDEARRMQHELAEVIARYEARGDARRTEAHRTEAAGPVAAHVQIYATSEAPRTTNARGVGPTDGSTDGAGDEAGDGATGTEGAG